MQESAMFQSLRRRLFFENVNVPLSNKSDVKKCDHLRSPQELMTCVRTMSFWPPESSTSHRMWLQL
jgi:hypothetical protein